MRILWALSHTSSRGMARIATYWWDLEQMGQKGYVLECWTPQIRTSTPADKNDERSSVEACQLISVTWAWWENKSPKHDASIYMNWFIQVAIWCYRGARHAITISRHGTGHMVWIGAGLMKEKPGETSWVQGHEVKECLFWSIASGNMWVRQALLIDSNPRMLYIHA